MHQKTVKTLDLLKPLTKKSNSNFGPHKNFEIKNKKEKTLKTSVLIKTLQRKLKSLIVIKALKRKV